jgi:hypothetical protein
MAKSGRIIKISENGNLFVSRVVRHGAVQRAFAEQIGKVAGACVRSGVHAGMGRGEIRDVVKKCGKSTAGTKLHLRGSTGAKAPRPLYT